MQYANYIKSIEITSLWNDNKHIVWNLDKRVNILSGINGIGKTTILNKILKHLRNQNNEMHHNDENIKIELCPNDANKVRIDVIRSFDKLAPQNDTTTNASQFRGSDLDKQLYNLQRKFLDYQVNIGNRIISTLQKGEPNSAQEAFMLAKPKETFQNIIDKLFADTNKTIIRTENEVRLLINNKVLTPYELSSGEKQILIILLTVLIEDNKPFVLFMDEPEASLHPDWQQQLIDLILTLNSNVQIILTTHSPALIMNGWIDKVTEVSDITI